MIGEQTAPAMRDMPTLRRALQPLLIARFGPGAEIRSLGAEPVLQQSSFALRGVVAQLGCGRTIRAILKATGRAALLPDARRARPEFLHDPRREIDVYEAVLPAAPPGTAALYGSFAGAQPDGYWICLERVDGVELYQVGDFSMWEDVARWLAVLHARFTGGFELIRRTVRPTRLLRYDEAYSSLWLRRALEIQGARELSGERRAGLAALERVHERVLRRLGGLPPTVVHGDFHASNILVAEAGGSRRICAVDWEMAGIGPGLLDLAALVSGNWSEEQSVALARAYHGAFSRHAPGAAGSFAEMLEALYCCRFQVALQYLGWSADWTPPKSQRHDWLGEAIELARKLEAA